VKNRAALFCRRTHLSASLNFIIVSLSQLSRILQLFLARFPFQPLREAPFRICTLRRCDLWSPMLKLSYLITFAGIDTEHSSVTFVRENWWTRSIARELEIDFSLLCSLARLRCTILNQNLGFPLVVFRDYNDASYCFLIIVIIKHTFLTNFSRVYYRLLMALARVY